MGKGSKKPDIYDYLMSMDYGICHGPLDAINSITVKDKIAWQYPITENSGVEIDEDKLFGGDEKEGGLSGVVEFYLGGDDQISSPELAARFGEINSNVSGYRGLAHMFFRGEKNASGLSSSQYDPDGGMTEEDFLWAIVAKIGIIGKVFASKHAQGPKFGFRWGTNNPYLPPPVAHVTRRPRGLSADGYIWPIIKRENGAFVQSTNKLNPDGSLNYRKCPDANPAHMLYELMTNPDWGKGDPESAFNKASYLAAAATLKTEMFGLSMRLMDQDSIENFSSEILDHIKAMQFQDPTTGLWTLKLIRDDYVKSELAVFGPGNCEVVSLKKRGWPDVINQIRVTYTEPFTEEPEAVTAENNAVVAVQGRVVSETRDYYGVRNKFLAQQIADRDVAEASRLLTTVKLKVNREGFDSTPGGCVILNWPEEGISEMVLRLNGVDWGHTTDREIVIEATEDVYATPKIDFQEPQAVEWVDPDAPPTKAEYIYVTEPPLPLMTTNGYTIDEVDDSYPLSAVQFYVNDPDMAIIEVTATATVVDGAGSSSLGEVASFSPATTSELGVSLVPENTSELPEGLLEALKRARSQIGDIYMIEGGGQQEWIMTDGSVAANETWRVVRGLWDTVPLTWGPTARIWRVVGSLTNTDNREVFIGDAVSYYLRPRTRSGLLDVRDTDLTTYTVGKRIHAPFRPAKTQINGKGFGAQQYLSGSVPLTVPLTWANRNRTSEDAVANKWNASTVTPETGQTTRIKAVAAGTANVEMVFDGLTGTAFDMPTENLLKYRFYDIGFYSVRDGVESITGAKRTLEIERLGWGNNFGYDWSENDG